MTIHDASVAERVTGRLPDLRPAERRVARALLADYPRGGLDTAAALARRAGVSAPTVLRFAHALGFDGFPELQAALLDEISFRAKGPLGRDGWGPRPAAPGSRLLVAAEESAAAAVGSVRDLAPAEADAAADALADVTRRVTTVGGRYSGVLATLLAVTLETVRPAVSVISDPFGTDAARLVDLGRKDVVVAFDIPRYQASTIDTVALARRKRAKVVLVTDERLSPAAADSDIVLPVSVASPSPFAGITPATLLVELLILSVVERLGPSAQRRIDAWESFRRRELLGP